MNEYEDLLRENGFGPARRPERILLPDESGVPSIGRAPTELPESSAPEPFAWLRRRKRRIPVVAVILSLLLHGGLLYLALIAPVSNRPPLAFFSAPMRKTEPVSFVFVDQPEAPPPTRPPRKRNYSDRDREARGGERIVEDGRTPKLSGKSAELVYHPRKAKAADRQGISGPVRKPTTNPKLEASPRGLEAPNPEESIKKRLSQMAVPPGYRAVQDGGMFDGTSEMADSPGEGAGREGTVSFETSWFNWGDYATRMLREIKWNWVAPHALYIGVKGHVRVSFVIERNGTVTHIRLLRGSGTVSYDEAALAAIRDASPLPPLPDEFPFDHEEVTINFLYNMSRVAARREESSRAGG